MAPLTWRNVDSPSFASANQLYTLAAELMNRGFNSASRGVDKFREITTDEQSARLMQDVMAAGDDPAAIQAAATRGNAAFLSPEALRFTNAQPGVLLDRQQAKANIAQTGVRTNALQYGLDRSRITDGREDAQYTARQEANPLIYQMQELARNGDLSGAQALAAQNADLLSRAGINADTIYNGISSGYTGQMADTERGVQHGDFMRIAGNAASARELIDRAGQMFGTEEEARRAIQDAQARGVISADLAQTALGSLGQAGLWTAPSEADAAMRSLFPDMPTMNDRGSTPTNWATGLNGQNPVFNGFMSTIQRGGVTNPYALAAIAATGQHESGFDPGNAGRTWNDPSESGRPGTAGGIMSWNNERLAALQRFTGGDMSPEAQAAFFLQENPQLITRLNNAGSVEEAVALMNNAWRFAGYNRPGGEAQARLETARSIYSGTPPSFGSNVPRAGTQPGASVYDQMMAAAAQDSNRTPLTFGQGNWTPEGGLEVTVTDDNPVNSIMAAASADPTASETAGRTTPLVVSPQAADDGGARANQMMAQVLAQPVEDVQPAQIVEAGTAGDNPLFTKVDGGVVARPPMNQQETLLIARASRAGILQTTPQRAARQAEIDRVTQMMSEASEIAPNANRPYLQPGGLLGDLGMVAAQTGEAVVNQGGALLDTVNAPFRMLSEYALGRDYIGGAGRVDWNGDGYAQSLTSSITGTTLDNLTPEQRAAMTGGDAVTNAMNAALSSNENVGQQPGQGQLPGQQTPAATPTRPPRVEAAELASFLRTAANTGNADQASDLHAGLDRAVVEGDNGKTNLQELSARLTGSDGALSSFDQGEVSMALNRISRELNVSLPVAAELLGGSVVYTGSDWNPLNWGSDLQYDMGEIRDRWRLYDQGNADNAARLQAAVARLNNRDRSQSAVTSVGQLQTVYEQMVTQMNQQLAGASSQARRDQIKAYYEREVFPRIYERVQAVGSTGALTMYSGASTGQ